jgi:hypothetical protein
MGGMGDQDLLAMAGRADSGCPMHVEAGIVTGNEERLACMDAHPHSR